MHKRVRHIIQGQVQGVGFRPFVYKLATKHNLSGFVSNNIEGVIIEVEGSEEKLNEFFLEFKNLPPLAKIISHKIEEIPNRSQGITLDNHDFIIKHTDEGSHHGHSVLISPDTATCSDCLQDIFDENNLRYAYPFTNCTNCGPRYTITSSIPYDRAFTSMACFSLCQTCKTEYENPLDRRFHAQPNACPECGPSLWLNSVQDINLTHNYNKLPENTLFNHDALIQAINLLNYGAIIAIKSLGGFQLCCDATNYSAVEKLRLRKNRPHKAFAVMVFDLESADKIAELTPQDKALLLSAEAPIVLCPKKQGVLPDNIAPDTNRIGIMLAYTPLHKILLNPACLSANLESPKVLIMTSANAGGEPICIKNRHALETLSEITDYFLFHNRDILVRVDDSVCFALPETKDFALPNKIFFRRARGYVPSPIQLPKILESKKPVSVLGVGAFLKNTFTLTKKNQAFVSQHIGDLDNLAVLEFYEETFNHLLKLLEVKPKAVVCDLHPDFPSTRFARDFAQNKIPIFSLAHHYAHAYAVLAEYEDYDLSPTLALILDGTGLGEDNEIWGGELLYIEPKTHVRFRLGRIKPFTLAGGEKAIYEPWRIAQALYENCLDSGYLSEAELKKLPYPWLKDSNCANMSPLLSEMLAKNIQCIKTSSCGRLFDAISALFGLCYFTSYEGQAAIKLEAAQGLSNDCYTNYQAKILENQAIKELRQAFFADKNQGKIQDTSSPIWELDSYDIFAHSVKMLIKQVPISQLAEEFHYILAYGFTNMVNKACKLTKTSQIVIGGGVLNNETLFLKLCENFKNLKLFTPQNMPSSDGAISLGQAFYGQLRMQEK